MLNQEDLRYPIGRFHHTTETSNEELEKAIKDIAVFPSWLEETAELIRQDQLNNTYRQGGWNIRQIIHHLADSHINAYIRFKLALTETKPIIKPYKEELWSELSDAKNENIFYSIKIIEGIHARWAYLMENMDVEQFQCCYMHPEEFKLITLSECARMYSWHGRHHLKHIQNALDQNLDQELLNSIF